MSDVTLGNAIAALFNGGPINVKNGSTCRRITGLGNAQSLGSVNIAGITSRRPGTHNIPDLGSGIWVARNDAGVMVAIATGGVPSSLSGLSASEATPIGNPTIAPLVALFRAFVADVSPTGNVNIYTNHAPAIQAVAQAAASVDAGLPAWGKSLVGIAKSRGADTTVVNAIRNIVSTRPPTAPLPADLVQDNGSKIVQLFAASELPPVWRAQVQAAGHQFNASRNDYAVFVFEQVYSGSL